MRKKGSVPHRPQQRKDRRRVSEAFTIFRPVQEESAEVLYEILKENARDILPTQATVQPPNNMRVTYVERSRMTKQLQGFAAGFNAVDAILRINNVCTSHHLEATVSLGKTRLMDRRDERLVVRLDHSQTVAEEYAVITDILSHLHLPRDRREFKPHISLAHMPNTSVEEKLRIAREVGEILPEEVVLSAMENFPKIAGQKQT